jgi:hypothetical protein
MFKKFLINYVGFDEYDANFVQCATFIATLITGFIYLVVLIVRITDKLLTFYGF